MRIMHEIIRSIVALAAVLSISACADGRACPPGTHLGPWGHACHPN
jgi:hypothetical protein